MAKEESAYMLLNQLPVLYLTLELGLELMRESGEPVEFGILDYSKVFSRAFYEGGMGLLGVEWEVGEVVHTMLWKCVASGLLHTFLILK